MENLLPFKKIKIKEPSIKSKAPHDMVTPLKNADNTVVDTPKKNKYVFTF